jgi:hypothetical protein
MHQGLTRAQGDPGFFSFIGKALKTVGGVIPGVGGVIQTIGGLLDPTQPRAVQQQLPVPLGVPRAPVRVPGVTGVVQRFLPGGATGFECPPGGGCPSGFRANRSAYFLKDGTFVAPGSRCVRIRRINPANGKAVRRAIRRENAFIGMAVKTGLVRAPRAARVRKAAGKR